MAKSTRLMVAAALVVVNVAGSATAEVLTGTFSSSFEVTCSVPSKEKLFQGSFSINFGTERNASGSVSIVAPALSSDALFGALNEDGTFTAVALISDKDTAGQDGMLGFEIAGKLARIGEQITSEGKVRLFTNFAAPHAELPQAGECFGIYGAN